MKIDILGVAISNLTLSEAFSTTEQLIKTGGTNFIVTPNPEIVMAAYRDAVYRRIINHAALALADGFGLLLASRLLGQPLKERVTGIDFVSSLAESQRYSFFLLGGQRGVAQAARENLQRKYSKVRIVGAESGGTVNQTTWKLSEPSILEKIERAQPDILLVAFGHPKQEQWIWNNLERLHSVKVVIAVGGTLDYLAGTVRRAPKMLRRLGLEWLFRLLLEPWRIKRILTATFAFMNVIIKSRYSKKEL